MWNVKGYLWNSTQNILTIHRKIRFLYNVENLKALRFTITCAFLNHPTPKPFCWAPHYQYCTLIYEILNEMTTYSWLFILFRGNREQMGGRLNNHLFARSWRWSRGHPKYKPHALAIHRSHDTCPGPDTTIAYTLGQINNFIPFKAMYCKISITFIWTWS